MPVSVTLEVKGGSAGRKENYSCAGARSALDISSKPSKEHCCCSIQTMRGIYKTRFYD
jgi:hypothetical protein